MIYENVRKISRLQCDDRVYYNRTHRRRSGFPRRVVGYHLHRYNNYLLLFYSPRSMRANRVRGTRRENPLSKTTPAILIILC